ncbi:MAG: LURP-one-related/scramblase family protein [Bulleidia sp.]
MNLLIRQRMFSWLDSYDIYAEDGTPAYTVKGEISFGHQLRIYEHSGTPIGLVKEVLLTFLPAFRLYQEGELVGTLRRKMSLFHPYYEIPELGWSAEGDFLQWNYTLYDETGRPAAEIAKKVLNFTDTYVLSIEDPRNALLALMIVLAIDAELCTAKRSS